MKLGMHQKLSAKNCEEGCFGKKLKIWREGTQEFLHYTTLHPDPYAERSKTSEAERTVSTSVLMPSVSTVFKMMEKLMNDSQSAKYNKKKIMEFFAFTVFIFLF